MRITAGRVVAYSRASCSISAAVMPVHAATRSGVYSRARSASCSKPCVISGNVSAVLQAFAQDHVHQAQRQGYVCSRTDGDVPVGQCRRARAVRIDDDETCAVAPRLLDRTATDEYCCRGCSRPTR